MTQNFPPRTTHEAEVGAMLNMLGSVVEGRAAVYVSAPITSGKRLSEWHARQNGRPDRDGAEYREGHRREVVEPNCAHARSIVRELRTAVGGVLIDPTAFVDLPGWTQDDYRDLWARVIERFAREAVFIDGWQYSNGCAFEFLTASRAGVVSLDERRRPIEPEAGLRLIRSAAAELRGLNLPEGFLERVAEELSRLLGERAQETWTK